MVQVLIKHQGQRNGFVDLFYLWELNHVGEVQTCYPLDMTSTITGQQQWSVLGMLEKFPLLYKFHSLHIFVISVYVI